MAQTVCLNFRMYVLTRCRYFRKDKWSLLDHFGTSQNTRSGAVESKPGRRWVAVIR